jgi:hypothetical protein
MRELEAEEVEAVTSVMEFWISQLPQLSLTFKVQHGVKKDHVLIPCVTQ